MSTAAVVLAAGLGRRFGATKQVAEVEGRPLVVHAVAAALAAGVGEVVVVLGHEAATVRATLPADPRVRAVINEHHAEGIATSLRTGIAVLGPDVEAAVVLLADQPGVTSAAVARVAAAVTSGAEVARAVYDDGPSHPVAFARRAWPVLGRATGDVGARQVLDRFDVTPVRVEGPAPRDVDHPEDLDALESDRP